MEHDFLDELVGTHLSTEILVEKLLPVEVRLIDKLVKDFQLTKRLRNETIRALYRFKMLLRHYSILWSQTRNELTVNQQGEGRKIFTQIQINLDRPGRGVWSQTTFFTHVRILLYACKKLGLPLSRMEIYLRWLYNFPVVPEKSIKAVFDHELWPANQPHKYMFMTAGLIRQNLSVNLSRTQITRNFYEFLRERNIPRAHSRWFAKRSPGSYGSRQ